MKDISRLQSIIYSGLMDARFKPEKSLLKILDETVDWVHDAHFVQEYDSSAETVMKETKK
jgi:hypothetical protein